MDRLAREAQCAPRQKLSVMRPLEAETSDMDLQNENMFSANLDTHRRPMQNFRSGRTMTNASHDRALEIKHVYTFANGMCIVFDQRGQQMPEYGGPIDEAFAKLRAAGFDTSNAKQGKVRDVECGGADGPYTVHVYDCDLRETK